MRIKCIKALRKQGGQVFRIVNPALESYVYSIVICVPPVPLNNMSFDKVPETMKAIVWEGKPFHMSLKDIPVPKLEHPNDVLIRITTSAICGTDLHTYRGLLGSTNPPWTMGHEAIGIIVQAGKGVKTLKVGDRVAVSVIACGYCDNCLRGRSTYCLTFNPSTLVDFPGLGDDFGSDLGGCQGAHSSYFSPAESLLVWL